MLIFGTGCNNVIDSIICVQTCKRADTSGRPQYAVAIGYSNYHQWCHGSVKTELDHTMSCQIIIYIYRACICFSTLTHHFYGECCRCFVGRIFTSQIREASKTSGGVSKNKRKATKKKYRGIKVEDGAEVQKGSILCTQLQLRYYPGENVCTHHMSYHITTQSYLRAIVF